MRSFEGDLNKELTALRDRLVSPGADSRNLLLLAAGYQFFCHGVYRAGS
jgi:hypothetical protein